MFYGSLFAMTLLGVGLGTLLVWVALAQEPIDYTMILFALFFLLMLMYTVYKFSKNTPIVRLNDEGIRYAGRWYGWGQIISADFTEQKRFPTIGKAGTYMPAITLTFDQGNELCIFDTMYDNGNAIRNYLQSRVGADLHVQPEIDKEPLDEATVRIQKKKTNLFTFFLVACLLLSSFLIVFFDLSKGLSILIIILLNILFMFVFKKYSGEKEMSRKTGRKIVT